jgi:hypothetical protein
LLYDMVWHALYEAYGGEPLWAAVDLMYNLRSRHEFMLANFEAVFTHIGRNVDIAPLLFHVRYPLPPALSDVAPPPTNVPRPPTEQIFVRRAAWFTRRSGESVYSAAGQFRLAGRYIADDDEEEHQ